MNPIPTLPLAGQVALVVRDYDEAIAFYRNALGFRLMEDIDQGHKRWVVMAPALHQSGPVLLLARASSPDQAAFIGNQAGGRVFLFLQTLDFTADLTRMQQHGVRFLEAPRQEVYGQVVVWQDLYGNKWDLIEPA